MQVSVIVTVFNEARTINWLLVALANQTKKPDEIVIVDANSTDNTLQLIKVFAKHHQQINLKFYTKIGNRSVGRNYAIQKATNDWLAVTDAGCIPYNDWLEKLIAAKTDKNTIVAGYYDAKANTPFEEAVVPYVLVMPDRIDEDFFLPATRSMLMHRSVWEKLNGFDEKLTVSEDYHFAKKMVNSADLKIVFTAKAKVSWLPRQNLTEFYRMVQSMAKGDAEGKIIRLKVWMVIIRYLFFIIFSGCVYFYLFNFFNFTSLFLLTLWIFMIGLYLLWAVSKNQKYTPSGWHWLPILQIASDAGVIAGTIQGLMVKNKS